MRALDIELPPGWRQIDEKQLRFEISYCLKMASKSLRNDLAEKSGGYTDNKRDQAAELIAMQIIEHMKMARWGVIAPPIREAHSCPPPGHGR